VLRNLRSPAAGEADAKSGIYSLHPSSPVLHQAMTASLLASPFALAGGASAAAGAGAGGSGSGSKPYLTQPAFATNSG
ncbi:hypothetical protein ABTE19_23155, partial [Acinetobacter baumannii]